MILRLKAFEVTLLTTWTTVETILGWHCVVMTDLWLLNDGWCYDGLICRTVFLFLCVRTDLICAILLDSSLFYLFSDGAVSFPSVSVCLSILWRCLCGDTLLLLMMFSRLTCWFVDFPGTLVPDYSLHTLTVSIFVAWHFLFFCLTIHCSHWSYTKFVEGLVLLSRWYRLLFYLIVSTFLCVLRDCSVTCDDISLGGLMTLGLRGGGVGVLLIQMKWDTTEGRKVELLYWRDGNECPSIRWLLFPSETLPGYDVEGQRWGPVVLVEGEERPLFCLCWGYTMWIVEAWCWFPIWRIWLKDWQYGMHFTLETQWGEKWLGKYVWWWRLVGWESLYF
jgi:hypothetical protein